VLPALVVLGAVGLGARPVAAGFWAELLSWESVKGLTTFAFSKPTTSGRHLCF